MGQSAGALSALIHRAHPQTSSLVKQMILMSPPALPFSTMGDLSSKLQLLTKSICQSASDLERFECLKNQSMMALLAVEQNEDAKISKKISKALPPVVDYLDILEHPFDILKNKAYMDGARVLIGSNSNESYLFLNKLYPGTLSTPMFNMALYLVFINLI